MYKDMVTKNDLKNKYIFWDIDGTLAAYRFNGIESWHISSFLDWQFYN